MKNAEPLRMETGETTIDISGAQHGPHAGAHDFMQVSNQSGSRIDLEVLVGGLERLRLEISRTQHKGCEEYKALINLACAEREAKAGNEARMVEHLKKAGKRALGVATKMGIPVVTDSKRDATEV